MKRLRKFQLEQEKFKLAKAEREVALQKQEQIRQEKVAAEILESAWKMQLDREKMTAELEIKKIQLQNELDLDRKG